jgi:hypothetical protein
VLLFGGTGLFFPELRRVLALKRYESDLNGIVVRTDNEIFRMDLDLLTLGPVPDESAAARPPSTKAASSEAAPGEGRIREGGR